MDNDTVIVRRSDLEAVLNGLRAVIANAGLERSPLEERLTEALKAADGPHRIRLEQVGPGRWLAWCAAGDWSSGISFRSDVEGRHGQHLLEVAS